MWAGDQAEQYPVRSASQPGQMNQEIIQDPEMPISAS